ncbi:MAG TPA: tetratricopeptide repeat protein, partial [Blastocatellia bacterium]|nr:tetratricopeptide repeat protein [Blastocatellia bacterium]
MASRDLLSNRRVSDIVAAGEAAVEESRFEEAANHFRTALRMGTASAEEEAHIRCQLSEALEKRGLNAEQLEAVARYDKFSEFSRLSERTQMLVLIRLGWGYSVNNDIPRSIALFNQAMQIARRLEDHSGLGACFFGLGRAYRNFSEIRIARDHYTSALEHFRQTGDWRKLAESYIHIGHINAFEGDFRGALLSIKQALTIIGDKDEANLLGRAYMYLAITHDNLGSTSKALNCWEKCIDYFRRAGNATFIAINQNNLAEKLVWLGEWPRAEQLMKEAIEMLGKTPNVAQYGGAVDTLAELYLLQGKLDEADRLLEESLNILSAFKTGEGIEISTQVTIGRSNLIKGDTDSAIKHLERAIEICERWGDHHLLSDARLWLAEALLQKGQLNRARAIVENVQSSLRDAPNMRAWGLMMRMVAKVEAASGHIAAAIQSLGQSTSMFELRENSYACAVNRMVLAGLHEQQGRIAEAIADVEAALATFERLGAKIDLRRAKDYLLSLRSRPAERAEQPAAETGSFRIADLDLASAVDGFTAQRIVQAAISRELLLHELASIARAKSLSRSVLVAESTRNEDAARTDSGLRIATVIGLAEGEQREALEYLKSLDARDYNRSFV